MNLNDDVIYRRLRLGRSTSVIPAVPAAWSVTTIAFMILSLSAVPDYGYGGWEQGGHLGPKEALPARAPLI